MILGLLALVMGNIFIWRSDEETTQFFAGWVIGVLSIIVAPSLPRLPRIALASVACVFIIVNEQTLTQKPSKLTCVHGEARILEGVNRCVCIPPYIGELCDTCPPGAINEGNETHPKCSTCHHQYIYPHCINLQPGYKTETECYDRWVPSCLNDFFDLSANPKTYDVAFGTRNRLYDMAESDCLNDANGTVYCDKCKEGHAGPDCCPDGKYGQNCRETVPICNADMDYDAVLRPNKMPTSYGLTDPEICYDTECTCGGEFIGDALCVSNLCVEGKCADMERSPLYEDRCKCDVGVGPNCVTPPCYGGTRMWEGGTGGKAICRCNAKHTDSYKGLTFDACEMQTNGTCFPDLFGEQCKECQCAVDVSEPFDTKQCEKTHYGVFERDFRTNKFRGSASGCMTSGTCTTEPDDCGVVKNGSDRCTLFTNQITFTAILFSGDNCTNTTDSKCAVWEPCRPR